MELDSKVNLSEEIEEQVLLAFSKLPLSHKLVIYAKFVHGSNFKSQNGDLLNLSRRSVSKIYKTFIETLQNKISP